MNKKTVERLWVLGQSTRMAIFEALLMHDGTMSVNDIVEKVAKKGQPTISHHLLLLHMSGFVWKEEKGTYSYYHVNREAVRELGEYFLALAELGEKQHAV